MSFDGEGVQPLDLSCHPQAQDPFHIISYLLVLCETLMRGKRTCVANVVKSTIRSADTLQITFCLTNTCVQIDSLERIYTEQKATSCRREF